LRFSVKLSTLLTTSAPTTPPSAWNMIASQTTLLYPAKKPVFAMCLPPVKKTPMNLFSGACVSAGLAL